MILWKQENVRFCTLSMCRFFLHLISDLEILLIIISLNYFFILLNFIFLKTLFYSRYKWRKSQFFNAISEIWTPTYTDLQHTSRSACLAGNQRAKHKCGWPALMSFSVGKQPHTSIICLILFQLVLSNRLINCKWFLPSQRYLVQYVKQQDQTSVPMP